MNGIKPLTPGKGGWEVPALATNSKSHYCVRCMCFWIRMGFCKRESKCTQRNYRNLIKALGHLLEILMKAVPCFSIFHAEQNSNTVREYWNAVLLSACFLSQLEEQLSRVQREKNDLQSRMEEDQEDMNELMKKHKAAVAQVTPFFPPPFCLYPLHRCFVFECIHCILNIESSGVYTQPGTLPPAFSLSETAPANGTGP